MPPSSLMSVARPLFCAHCGYDVRGATENRCSECGTVFDPADLAQSKFPFALAKRWYSPLAYLRTVWMVSIWSRRLKYEAVKPQDLRRAIAFRRITAGLVALLFMSVYL